ncbi:MAG TPA: pyruvate ferredoxin oxidoreductase [Dehalococcoidia bacterium]|nr:pyruvate ferredoxin oxidoreductase [Dehalococcoidia bacterium]
MEEKSIKFGKSLVPIEEFVAEGHNFCTGCGEALVIRLACKALGKNVIINMPTGCDEICTTPLPVTSWRVPWMHTLFENAAATISGVEAGLKILMKKDRIPRRDIVTVVMGGDGATSDIGVQALSGAMERGHNFLYICLDNEAYMNTGIQRSSATPYGASTTTAPAGKVSIGQTTWKKDMVAIAVAHSIPYAATACPSYPFDLMNKVKKGAEVKGPAYINILSPCPTGWRHLSNMTIEIGRLAVETGIFPIYEVENGHYRLNIDRPRLKPVEEYIKLQGRFRHLPDEEIKKIQERVNEEYRKLKAKVAAFAA